MSRARQLLKYLWAAPNTGVGLLMVPAALLTGGSVRRVRGVLEVHGGAIEAALRRVPIAGGAAALTLGHVVIGRNAETLDRHRGHEHIHVQQYEQWGPAFVPAYLAASAWAYLNGGDPYRDNFFEQEARRRSGEGA